MASRETVFRYDIFDMQGDPDPDMRDRVKVIEFTLRENRRVGRVKRYNTQTSFPDCGTRSNDTTCGVRSAYTVEVLIKSLHV